MMFAWDCLERADPPTRDLWKPLPAPLLAEDFCAGFRYP